MHDPDTTADPRSIQQVLAPLLAGALDASAAIRHGAGCPPAQEQAAQAMLALVHRAVLHPVEAEHIHTCCELMSDELRIRYRTHPAWWLDPHAERADDLADQARQVVADWLHDQERED